MPEPESQKTKSPGSKPVFTNGEESVFLNTRNITKGPKAGTTFEVFTYARGRGPEQYRIDVPVSVAGYDLRNNPAEKISDVVDLVNGREIAVTMTGKAKEGGAPGSSYDLLIGGLPPKEVVTETGQIFRSMQLVAAFAEFAREDVAREKPRAFTINGLDENNAESKEKNLKTYRFIAPPKDQQPATPIWVRVYISDAVAARDAFAAGKPFSFERDGCRVSLEGFDAVEVKAGAKPIRVMRWKTEVLQHTSEHADTQEPLPQRKERDPLIKGLPRTR